MNDFCHSFIDVPKTRKARLFTSRALPKNTTNYNYYYTNFLLDRHQILNTVLGELQDITLARVVLGVGTLIRCAVVVLH